MEGSHGLRDGKGYLPGLVLKMTNPVIEMVKGLWPQRVNCAMSLSHGESWMNLPLEAARRGCHDWQSSGFNDLLLPMRVVTLSARHGHLSISERRLFRS